MSCWPSGPAFWTGSRRGSAVLILTRSTSKSARSCCFGARLPASAESRQSVRLCLGQPEQIFATAIAFAGIDDAVRRQGSPDGAIGAGGYGYAVQAEISRPLSSFSPFANTC